MAKDGIHVGTSVPPSDRTTRGSTSGGGAGAHLDCVLFLQRVLPRLRMRWAGFRRVRRQVCRRIKGRLRELGLASLEDYEAYLRAHPEEWSRLDGLCRVSISRFWRDRSTFEVLRDDVLPALARGAAERGRKMLVAWSAGCASGEEPYTLVLLWRLAVDEAFPGIALQVTAVDADEVLLARARAALYPASSLRGLPAEYRERAFAPQGEQFALLPSYRTAVTFRAMDLRSTMPGGPFDLVLCRNLVFMYYDEELQRELAGRMLRRLRPGGALVVGSHETPPKATSDELELWAPGTGIYRKRVLADPVRPPSS